MVQAADRMLHLKDGWFCVAALVVVFFLPSPCRGQSKMVGPSQPILATIGDDIMLPCHLEPEEDVSHMTLEWTRPDLSPRFVYVWRDNIELERKKHPNYKERTSLSINKLKRGDISLTLSKVKLSDEGTYRCFIPTISQESSVELVVGSVSSSVIIFSEVNGELVLECKSKGWYPQPEVLWLDAEGNLLSAGPTETVRGPDDLYTVSSRVTVEKRHNNTFTCRVQQKNINQTRETHVHFPGSLFTPLFGPALYIIPSVTVLCVVLIAAGFVLWKYRCKRKGKKSTNSTTETSNNNTELLPLNGEKREIIQKMSESITIKNLDETKTDLERLKELEEEYNDAVRVVLVLMNQKADLEEEIKCLESKLIEVEKPIQPVTNTTTREGNSIKSTTEETDVEKCPETESSPDAIKINLENTEAVLKAVMCWVDIVTKKKEAIGEKKSKISEELEKQCDEMILQTEHYNSSVSNC